MCVLFQYKRLTLQDCILGCFGVSKWGESSGKYVMFLYFIQTVAYASTRALFNLPEAYCHVALRSEGGFSCGIMRCFKWYSYLLISADKTCPSWYFHFLNTNSLLELRMFKKLNVQWTTWSCVGLRGSLFCVRRWNGVEKYLMKAWSLYICFLLEIFFIKVI